MTPFHGVAVDLPGEAGSPEWIEARRSFLGASEVAAVLGFDPWASPYSVYAEKVGESLQRTQTPAMRFGKIVQGAILDECAAESGWLVTERGSSWRHPEEEWMLASPDGIVWGEANGEAYDEAPALVEAKTDFRAWEEPPDHVVIQCQWQMLVCGTDLVYVPLLAVGRREFKVYEVRRDPALVDVVVAGARSFWAHVTEGRPPPVDESEATRRALEALHAPGAESGEVALGPEEIRTLRELADVKAKEKALRDHRTLLENQIKEVLGDAAAGTWEGREVVTWRTVPRKGYWVEPTEYRRFDTKKID